MQNPSKKGIIYQVELENGSKMEITAEKLAKALNKRQWILYRYLKKRYKDNKYISKKEIDLNYGARQLKRKLQNIIENKIAEEVIRGGLQQGQKIIFDIKENEIKVDIE